MKNLLTVLCILIVVASGCSEHNHGNARVHLQPPAEAPAPAAEDCTSLILKMVDCMSFLGNDGNEKKPEASCCSGFKMVVHKDADCICEALKSSVSLGIDVNMTKAMKLPSACGLSSFSLKNCKVNTPSTASPPPKSPNVPIPTNPPASPSGPARTPSHQPPAPSPASSGAYTTCATFSILFSLVVSATSFLNVLA
ncbi:Non-specific lipid-transfer protein-like protein [Abeliophyllum distichum]|uniref:Non-specific lipid-transfer protein-like protein n=1 Tax=Abeliophyllum distichum TaxID=126358 RepID=A0ABD1Q606_9LAMI